jgi:hypothetical protein
MYAFLTCLKLESRCIRTLITYTTHVDGTYLPVHKVLEFNKVERLVLFLVVSVEYEIDFSVRKVGKL